MATVRKIFGISTGVLALALLPACSKPQPAADTGTSAPTETAVDAPPPAADNTDTVDGTKFAAFKGDAAAGETAFAVCKSCHSVEAGKNMTGPSLHGLIGHHSGKIAGFRYSPANTNSGIIWSEPKLFQYLEAPQRVIPGTKMAFAGVKDAQKRADIIAYLRTKS